MSSQGQAAEPRGDLRSVLRNGRWTFSLAWHTSAALTTSMLLLALLRGIVPAALALFARGLINSTAKLVGAHSTDISPVLPWILLGCGLSLIEAVAPLASRLCQLRFRDELNLRITGDILAHAATLDLEFFENPRTREIIERAQQNSAEHAARFLNQAIQLVASSFQLISLAVILVVIEPLVLVVLAPYTVPFLIFKWRLSRQQYAELHSRTAKQRWTRYYVSRLTSHESVAEVKMLRIAPLLRQKFRDLMLRFRDRDRVLHRKEFFGSSLFGTLTTLAFFALFFRVISKAANGSLTIGDVAVFGVITTRLRHTVEMAIQSIAGALKETLHISNLIRFLQEKPTVATAPSSREFRHIEEVEFEDVWFTYPGARAPTLRGASLLIEPGEVVGLVGENGAGKTTLVKLLCRLYDPERGAVRLGGVDVREIPIERLHAQVAFIFQKFGRYEATAADNIAFGDWERLQVDREGIETAARNAGVQQLVESLPEGYDTLLGRMFGDFDLSGGQWQYLALARAFARDASLLILDEPTANLDARAEYDLFCRFRDLARGRTTLLISHRFSTIGLADRILVMDQGRIVESGTHDELLSSGGSYAALYRLHRRQMRDDSLDG